MYKDIESDRDKGLSYISQGKDIFNAAKDVNTKESGFKLFMKGLELLLVYLKNEKHKEMREVVKKYVQGWVSDGEKMSSQIRFERGDPGSQNQTPPPQMKRSRSNPYQKNQEFQKPDIQKKNTTDDQKNEEKKDNPSNGFVKKLEDAIISEKPNVKWEDIAGLESAKAALQEAVTLPMKFPQFFDSIRKPWKGILLYGPPGTGKTLLAKACATETEATFFSVSAADLISKWLGDSEKLIKALFTVAKERKPSIIFIDEVDSLVSARGDEESEASRRVKTEFLVQMQGVGNDTDGILVLGATNIPWSLDPAVRRRFERRIYIPLPDQISREYLLTQQAKKTKHLLSDKDIEELAKITEGFSGADLSILFRDACFEPVRMIQEARFFRPIGVNKTGETIFTPCEEKDVGAIPKKLSDFKSTEIELPPVTMNDFKKALLRCKPSVGPKDLLNHIEFTKKFGEEGS